MAQAAHPDTLRAFPVEMVRSNRGQGLMREVVELIDAADGSIELDRLSVALRALANMAAGRAFELERADAQIERARNVRKPRSAKLRLRLV